MRELQQRYLFKSRSHSLHTKRHAICVGKKWNRNTGNSDQIRINGIDISEIHRNWVVHLLSDGKCGGGGGGKDNYIEVVEYEVGAIDQQFSHLLGLGEIGIVVACAQYKGSQ